ncbi:hypothetical protein [Piscinibacter sp. XHJ-5]|uniref:hypothetical protein n=1 Tax=Piscinibacter sp. XHJ-5 TaxID=3037797 RepID=UPI002452C4DA|nr:hypothetical protein [Piscinibacter sp. XHJ-5]
MDKPSIAMAIIGAAAASLVFGGASDPKAGSMRHDVPAPSVGVSSPRAANPLDCPEQPVARRPNPPVVPPTGPTDRQVNTSGTGAAGGAGTVAPTRADDPCAPTGRMADRLRSGTPYPASGASR